MPGSASWNVKMKLRTEVDQSHDYCIVWHGENKASIGQWAKAFMLALEINCHGSLLTSRAERALKLGLTIRDPSPIDGKRKTLQQIPNQMPCALWV